MEDELTDEELSLFELALAIHMSVSDIIEMPYEEYVGWSLYFNKRPLGWREDHRTYLIMSSFGADIKPEDVFPSLSLLGSGASLPKTKGREPALNTMKGSSMLAKIKSAVGGDKIPL